MEILPQVLDRIHDLVGPSGYSPYQILFGRDRPLGNVPFKPPHNCEDGLAFFKRMERLDQTVSRVVEEVHRKRAKQINAHRKPPATYAPGDKVWYRRPEDTGDKTDTRWIGPCVVKSREGENYYTLEVAPNKILLAHATFMKWCREDFWSGKETELFKYRRSTQRLD